MSIFRSALRVMAAHKIYLGIYLVIMSMVAVFMAGPTLGASVAPAEDEFSPARPTVAVIDRDGSQISQAISAYVREQGEPVELVDATLALQDAVAQDYVDYILIIPAGYGDDLMHAAAAGGEAPKLQTAVSYDGAAGALANVATTSYLRSLYGFASTVASTQSEVVELTDSAMARHAKTSFVGSDATEASSHLPQYLIFSAYPLFTAITVMIAVLMKAQNKPATRRRMLASPVTTTSRNLQLFAAAAVFGLVALAWVLLLGAVLFSGVDALAANPEQVTLMVLANLAFAVFAVAVGIFIGQLGVGEEGANAISNIGGLVITFLGGVWVPLQYMPDGMRLVARLVPSFWVTSAIEGMAGGTNYAGVAPGVCILVVLAFAAAFFLGGLLVSRARLRKA
jgi:ABC-2 type transport system permease protein